MADYVLKIVFKNKDYAPTSHIPYERKFGSLDELKLFVLDCKNNEYYTDEQGHRHLIPIYDVEFLFTPILWIPV